MIVTIEKALEIIRHLEPRLAEMGYHSALTGSVLYHGASSKDVDIIIYHHNPQQPPAEEALASILDQTGFKDRYETDPNYVNRRVWVCGYQGIRVDFFLP